MRKQGVCISRCQAALLTVAAFLQNGLSHWSMQAGAHISGRNLAMVYGSTVAVDRESVDAVVKATLGCVNLQ